MAVIPKKWACEKCGHPVYDEPKGRVCGQDRDLPATPTQRAMGLVVIPVPCAGEFHRVPYDSTPSPED